MGSSQNQSLPFGGRWHASWLLSLAVSCCSPSPIPAEPRLPWSPRHSRNPCLGLRQQHLVGVRGDVHIKRQQPKEDRPQPKESPAALFGGGGPPPRAPPGPIATENHPSVLGSALKAELEPNQTGGSVRLAAVLGGREGFLAPAQVFVSTGGWLCRGPLRRIPTYDEFLLPAERAILTNVRVGSGTTEAGGLQRSLSVTGEWPRTPPGPFGPGHDTGSQ